MPSFTYSGPGERVYTEGRDSAGRHIGTVAPGDTRDFDEPPADGFWTPELPRDDEDENPGGETPDPGWGDPANDASERAAGE